MDECALHLPVGYSRKRLQRTLSEVICPLFFIRTPALCGILKHPAVELARLCLERKIWTGKKNNLLSFYIVNCMKTFYLGLLVIYFLRDAIYEKMEHFKV